MFSVLLDYSAMVAAPYIDISGWWMMFFFAFLQRIKQTSFLLSLEEASLLFFPACQFSVLVERFAVL